MPLKQPPPILADFKAAIPPDTSEAEEALKAWKVSYVKRADGMLIVQGSIKRTFTYQPRLPDLSSVIVMGDFTLGHNDLTSLEGCPRYIGGDFYCIANKLTSLKGAPEYVGGKFSCSSNELETLEGAPRYVGGDFSCPYNHKLKNLIGGPEEVGGDYECWSIDELNSLEGAPTWVGLRFVCDRTPKLKSLVGLPQVFTELHSDFGDFSSRSEIPAKLLSDSSRSFTRNSPQAQRVEKLKENTRPTRIKFKP